MKTIYDACVVRALRYKLSLVLFSMLLFGSGQTFASHMAGGDLTYHSIGNNQYVITYTLYRDCFGIPAPGSVFVDLFSYSCNGFDTGFSLPAIPNTGNEITHNCGSAPTTCNGGSAPGIQQYIYVDTVTIPAQCPDWRFSVNDCCRNQNITTLANASGASMFIESYLNNLNVDHSSPTFSNIPIAFFCIGQTNYYNNGGIDPQGDSLVYALVPPLDGTNSPVTYNPGYSIANPISSTPPISIDPVTGDIRVDPTQAEVGVIAVQINQYRNGVLLGTVMRDIQVYTVVCSDSLPTLTGINGTTSFSTSSCAGGPLCFDVISNDTNLADTLTLSWNAGIPAASFTVTGTVRPVGHFCWTPTPADARPAPYTFTVTVRDNACPANGSRTYSFAITVSDLNVAVTSTPSVACHGDCTGSATATASGVPPLTYTWSGGGSTNLCAGTYSVTITDGSGCQGTRSFVITQPTALTATAITVAAGCSGNLGSMTATAAGGTSPYTYSPANPRTNLPAGTYTTTITDAHQCSTTVSATITSGTAINLSSATTDATCGSSNGSATVTATGGSGTLSYVWTPNVSSGATASNLPAGNYSVLVTDGQCPSTINITVGNINGVVASMTSTPAQCSDSSGSATVTTTGGTGPFTYVWTPNVSSGPTATNIPGGAYSVLVTDANGCSFAASTFVNSTGLTATITSTDANCQGSEDGSATVTASGGTPPYSYLWISLNDSNQTVSNLAPGSYTVRVTDYLGCSIYESVVIGFIHPWPSVELGNDTLICFGNTYTIDAGAGAGRTFLWSTGATTQTITVSTAGAYSVLVTDANGCENSDAVQVTFFQCFRPLPPARRNTGVLTVYPNPTSNHVEVNISQIRSTSVKILLSDILGNKLFYSQESTEYGYSKAIDMHQYAPGIYLLKVEYAGELNTIRVVKQ